MAGTSDRSLTMLATALEKEERGRDFYRDAVNKCGNELGKEMFRTLMAEEGVHITRIKQIYESLSAGRAWTSEWRDLKGMNENLQELFRKRMAGLGPKVQPVTGDVEALEIGIEMEQGAINFYQEELQKAVDPFERDFLSSMIVEERGHYDTLSDMRFYYTNPESWFVEHERHGLDGA
jgi:rubrerythrin